MSEWRDIEEYPADGTEVLVCATHSLGAGEWETNMWVDWRQKGWDWNHWKNRIDLPIRPSHWMPLPDAPAKPTGE